LRTRAGEVLDVSGGRHACERDLRATFKELISAEYGGLTLGGDSVDDDAGIRCGPEDAQAPAAEMTTTAARTSTR
jgi:hypothetical protein